MPRTISVISADEAQEVLRKAAAKAIEIGIPMAIAVVDTGGNLVAFVRQDNAILISINIAQDKARTALIGYPTEKWAELMENDYVLANLQFVPGFTALGGGVPIISDGQIIGGLGISGGMYTDDMVVAQAAFILPVQ